MKAPKWIAIPVLAGLVAAPVWSAEPTGFEPPSEPMVLTRELVRPLSDGKQVVVTRSWEVHFTPLAGGTRIDGKQIAVTVDVPPKLAALAEVERNRRDTGTFPIRLDSRGFIVPQPPEDPGPIEGLSEAAGRVLAARGPEGRRDGNRFVAMVQQAGARMETDWPRDLFYPAGAAREEDRRVSLPGAAQAGSIATRFAGTLDPSGHHLARAERRIVTTLSGDTRTSVETWTLTSIE